MAWHLQCRYIGKLIAVVLTASFIISVAPAEDWPQFLGPARNAISTETGLRTTWPKQGPPVLWKVKVGEGFAAPVIAGDRLIVFHRLGGKEVITCRNANTGKQLWAHFYDCPYQDGLGKGDGPRSTPVIAGDRVFTLGVTGWLHCLHLKTGKQFWKRALLGDYRVPESYFGVGTSPMVVGDNVLVNVGGRNAGIVAFATKTGKERWRATTDGASYSSPCLAKIGGQQRAVFLTRQGVVMLDPATGKVLHQQLWKARYAASVNAATPLAIGNLLFFSASYETGALLLQAKGEGAKEVWKGDDIMSNHYNTCVHHDGYLYGIHGRQERRQAKLRCVALKTGKMQWTVDRFGCASLIFASGNIIALTEFGELLSITPTPKGYREVARATVFRDTPCRAELALANGKLYGRDNSQLVCWDLRKK